MLGGELRDRARVVKSVKGATRVGGAYQRTPEFGPWFRCLYDPGDENEARSIGGVRRRHTGAVLVTGRRALDGSEITLKASEAIEIDSPRYGSLRLDIVGAPEPLTKRISRIGWVADLGKTNRTAPG